MQKLLKYKYFFIFVLHLLVLDKINFVNAKQTVLLINSDSNIYYQINNHTNISIKVTNVSDQIDLIFLQNFHKLWFLKLENFNYRDVCFYIREVSDTCPDEYNIRFYDLLLIFNKPVFIDSHKLIYDYANQWTIDPEYIKANFDKSYYKENPDGSIDIELTLYFKPQSYFYLGIIISSTTLILCVMYLFIYFIRQKKGKNIEILAKKDYIKP